MVGWNQPATAGAGPPILALVGLRSLRDLVPPYYLKSRCLMPLYPLRFAPVFRRYLWGGRQLGTVLNKPIGAETCAESWEVVDHGADQSVVTNGPLRGKTLGEIVREFGPELLGQYHPQTQFPLLFKFIDAAQPLSVQVHPDDARAALLTPPDFGKTEAWVVLAAQSGSLIYAGLKRGFDRAALEREVDRGTSELCLHRFEPKVGDCMFLPAGVVHALGAGILIAEIQQSSDTTYRLFDWNRVGPDGSPRPLHIEPALDAIDYAYGPVSPQRPEPTDHPGVERLVACDKFLLERWTLSPDAMPVSGGVCRIVSVIAGRMAISSSGERTELQVGDTVLVPAGTGELQFAAQPTATVLVARLP